MKYRCLCLAGVMLGCVLSPAQQPPDTPLPELVLQSGHTNAVNSVAFSPDGRLLASGGADNTVILWDTKSWHELRVLDGGNYVHAVTFSPDSKLLAAGTGDARVHVWEVSSGRQILELRGHTNQVNCIAFNHTGSLLASAGWDGVIKLWEVRSGRELKSLTGHQGFVYSVAFSPDDKTLASGSGDKTIRLWNPKTGAELRKFVGHKDEVLTVAFTADGKNLVSGDGNYPTTGLVKIWDLASGREVRSLPPQKGPIAALAFAANGALITEAFGGSPVLWDMKSGRQTGVIALAGGGYSPESMALSRDGKTLAVGNLEGTVLVADPDTGKTSQFLPRRPDKRAPTSSVWDYPEAALEFGVGVTFSNDGLWLASASAGAIHLWETGTGTQALSISEPQMLIEVIAFSPNSKSMASGNYDGSIAIWDIFNGTKLRSLIGHTKPVGSIVFNAAGNRLASSSDDGTIKIWDSATGALISSWESHSSQRNALAFSQDGRFLLSRNDNDGLTVWDPETGGSVRTLAAEKDSDKNGDRNQFPTVVFGHNGKLVASNSGSTVRVWMFETGQQILTLRGHPDEVTALAFSANDTALVSGSQDRTIEIWDLSQGAERATFRGGTSAVTSLSTDSTGQWLASIGWDGITRLWALNNGREACNLISLARSTQWLVTTPSGFFDGTEGAWRLGMWRFRGNTFDVSPLEVFLNEYFHPGLLADVLSGNRLPEVANIGEKDRRQPVVSIRMKEEDLPANLPENVKKVLRETQSEQYVLSGGRVSVADRVAQIEVEVAGAKAEGGRAGGRVRDVRLFRNGSLIKVWHGDVPLNQDGVAVLPASVTISAGENRLSAYAFNQDDIKSEDAEFTIKGNDELKRRGTTYILTIGVNEYQNPDFNLRYAVADAQEFASVLREQQVALARFESVEVVPLVNHDASRSNILLALERFGDSGKSALPNGAPDVLSKIHTAQPEDEIFVFFAGHGVAKDERFYLVPSDLGYAGKRSSLSENGLNQILARGISDLDMEAALEKIDAGEMVFLVDACNSGQVLEGARRGPMNSQGLAQLAFEKGMYVLAAAQSYQAALELPILGHGLLTYTLVNEGMQTNAADLAPPDGQVTIREWFDYATRRVPQLQLGKMDEARQQGRSISFGEDGDARGFQSTQALQRPRVFYGRDQAVQMLVIALTKAVSKTD